MGLAALAATSLLVGVGEVSLATLLSADQQGRAMQLLLVSRIPRTVAVIFCGMSLAIGAIIMQLLLRNRFLEPTTAGTAEAASLGLLLAALFAPGLPVFGKMLFAACVALAATFLFVRIIERLAWRTEVIVPLIGLMLGAVLHALTVFLAYRYDLLQSLSAWTNGDFSGVLRGRYELLWITVVLALAAYALADRLTIAGLGETLSTNLGLGYRATLSLGLVIVALITAACMATAGIIPFLGLIVANVVSMIFGDNLRRNLPWTALAGAGFLLACDIVGRLVRYPYEIPVGTVAGVIGSAVFLYLLFARRLRLG
jgi:iron complex transport system permease protein